MILIIFSIKKDTPIPKHGGSILKYPPIHLGYTKDKSRLIYTAQVNSMADFKTLFPLAELMDYMESDVYDINVARPLIKWESDEYEADNIKDYVKKNLNDFLIGFDSIDNNDINGFDKKTLRIELVLYERSLTFNKRCLTESTEE